LLCFLDDAIDLCEEILQKPMRRFEGVAHAFVAPGAVTMVVGQAQPGELELLRRLHRMCVVVAQDSGAILVVQRQAVPDAMWSML
jgi:hypothetical protein